MKKTLISIARSAVSVQFWRGVLSAVYHFCTFFILLILFLLSKLFSHLLFMPVIGRLLRGINFATGKTIPHYEEMLSTKLDGMRPSEVKRSYLINLAFKNLLAKKTRSFITMFGMAVGIGIIVFLLSLGYGIERLVISKVASLDELRMIDVSSSENTSLRLSKTIYDKILKLPKIENVIPLVSIVGKINYKRATTDVLVYAVPRSYLDALKLQPKHGKFFANNQSFDSMQAATKVNGTVQGAQTQIEKISIGKTRDVYNYTFSIYPQKTVLVSEQCDIASTVLGYTTRVEGGFMGRLYWGSQYSPFDDFGRGGYDFARDMYAGRWARGTMPLYTKNTDDTLTPLLDDMGRQVWKEGCIQERYIQKEQIIQVQKTAVLGEATGSASIEEPAQTSTFDAVVVSSDSAGFEMVSLQASGAGSIKKGSERINYSSPPEGVAVVSTGLLQLLGIAEKNAVGTRFSSSFIISKSLLPSTEGKVLSEEKQYEVIGVIDDPNNTYFYIPYADIKKLALPNVSQFKVILKEVNTMASVRKEIETLGFRTNSTSDTVKQIESLFVNLRLVLGVLGLVALGVAALGMFNTLTVSLLERTREIGGMKTMGMVSEEVQDLFLAEAMIMGLSGGIGGLTLGYLVGKGLSLAVSIVAVTQGQGYLDLAYIPLNFTIFILITSFIVGVVTGIYPAQRAKKISALNALRYE